MSNLSVDRDIDWKGVTSPENLKLAWARVRRGLLGESLLDEVEVRLFENRLDANLARLQTQLLAYAADVGQTEARIAYLVPKDASDVRVLGLSRIEEEILSVAIIQRLGQKVSALRGSSYAYRFARDLGQYDNEYLYEPWPHAYHAYIADVRAEAHRREGCAIIRTDIRGFFTRIVQHRLLRLTDAHLSESQRVRWLLRLLLSPQIDFHEAGRGIVQGNIGSGFYANIYLSDVDARFGANNEWGVKMYRYVDDMILIVPNPDHVSEVLGVLRTELDELGLELSENEKTGKTQIYHDVSDFDKDTARDERLERLGTSYDQLSNPAWICDSEYRARFREAYSKAGAQWWYLVEAYQACLKAVGLLVTPPVLSRRIYRYLYNDRRRTEDLKGTEELALPSLPIERQSGVVAEWAVRFQEQNPGWIEDRDALREELVDLLHTCWEDLRDGKYSGSEERTLARRLRFALNRLAHLGFDETHSEVIEILSRAPWLIREPGPILERLARWGFSEAITDLLTHYQGAHEAVHEYMRALILRAVRYLHEVDGELRDRVVQYATTGGRTDTLAASESCLFLAHRYPHLLDHEQLQAVEATLRGESALSHRLAKNYMLLLGQHDGSRVRAIPVRDDYLSTQAYAVASEGSAVELLGYHEPDVLRYSYYSGRRPYSADDRDDLDVSY